jgi:conjugal transfer mating pair stabilization protein TraG
MFGAYEVVTYGGGANYRDIFQAVALMSGTNAIGSLIRLAMLLGLVLTIARGMFDLNAGRALKWFIMCAVIYGVVFVPKVTVHITDKLNPALAGADVANVPIGVAFAESLASQVGSRAIDLTETAFGDPSDVMYSKTGMIYGAKFMDNATQVQFTDAVLTQNLATFFRECVFYDLTDNVYTYDEFAKANDIWTFVTTTHPPNPARGMVYISGPGGTGVGSNIITCPAAATAINSEMVAQTTNAGVALQHRLEPDQTGLTSGQAWSRLASQTTTLTGLTGMASTDAMTTIRQLAVLNIVKGTLAGEETSSGSALAQAQAEIQTHNTQSLLGPVGEKAIVVLKIVIDALFIGVFPILFPCFLLPQIGTKLLQGYFTGFFYLQLWGPMYVIIHKIIMTAAYSKTAAASFVPGATAGFNLQTVAGIGDINSQIQAVGSAMILMIPVIAAALTKGAMAVGSQGEALLQPFRSGAESAAASQSTGNYAFGTTAVNTHNFDSVTGNKIDTSRYVDTKRSTGFNDRGDMITANQGSGTVNVRAGAADSSMNMETLNERSTSLRMSANESRSRSNAYDTVISNARSEVASKVREAAYATSTGTDSRSGMSNESRDSQTQGLGFVTSLTSNVADQFKMSRGQAADLVSSIAVSESTLAQYQSSAGLSLGAGQAGPAAADDSPPPTTKLGKLMEGAGSGTLNTGGSISNTATTQGTDSSKHSYSANEARARDYVRSQMQSADARKAMDKVETQALNSAWGRVASTTSSTRNASSTTWSNSESFTQSARHAQTEASQIERSADEASRMAQVLRGDHRAAFNEFVFTGPNGGFLRHDANGVARSDGEIANILQGRTASDWGLLSEAFQSFAARQPELARPDLVTSNVKALGDPAGSGLGTLRSEGGDGSHLTSPSTSERSGGRRPARGESAADARIARTQDAVAPPSIDRNLAPGDALRDVDKNVDQLVDTALKPGRIKKPKPVTTNRKP